MSDAETGDMVVVEDTAVETLDDAVAVVGAVTWQPRVAGNRVALIEVVAPSVRSLSAPAVHTLGVHGLVVPRLSASTRARIAGLVGANDNPLRVGCAGDREDLPSRLAAAIGVVATDPHIDVVLIVFGEGVADRTVVDAVSGARSAPRPVLVVRAGQPWPVDTLSDGVGPVTVAYDDLARASRVIAALGRRR